MNADFVGCPCCVAAHVKKFVRVCVGSLAFKNLFKSTRSLNSLANRAQPLPSRRPTNTFRDGVRPDKKRIVEERQGRVSISAKRPVRPMHTYPQRHPPLFSSELMCIYGSTKPHTSTFHICPEVRYERARKLITRSIGIFHRYKSCTIKLGCVADGRTSRTMSRSAPCGLWEARMWIVARLTTRILSYLVRVTSRLSLD